MKIKIGNKIYTSKDQPIMIILSDWDKQNISNMLPECTKYCEFDDNLSQGQVEEFMKTD